MIEMVWAHYAKQPDDYAALCQFASTRIFGKAREFGQGNALAVIKDKSLTAAAIFYDYDADDKVLQFSLAGDGKRWMTRPVLKEMFSYAFDTVKATALVARIDPENTSLRNICKRYGFEEHIVPHLRGAGSQEAINILVADAWRSNGFHKAERN